VVLWSVGLAVVIVEVVFRSRGIDMRLVAAGAAVPLAVDLPLGRLAYGHALVVSVGVLAAVMVGTAGRSRLARRRLVCLPIGMLCGVAVSRAFLHDGVLLWPFLGPMPSDVPLVGPWPVVVVQELVGAGALAALALRHRLADPERLRRFLRTGRLG
jgi:hypothetical protein